MSAASWSINYVTENVTQRTNTTSSTKSTYYSNPQWIASVTVTFASAAFVVYTTVALAYYAYKKQILTCGRDSRKAWGSRRRTDNSIVRLASLFSSVTLLCYLAMEMSFIREPVSPYCVHFRNSKVTFYWLTYTAIYFAMWYRVFAAFYCNPIIKSTTNMLPNVINALTFVTLCVMLVANLVVYLWPRSKNYACKGKGELFNVRKIISATIPTIFQALLLFIFAYPLVLHQRKMLNGNFNSKSTMPIIKRAAITATVAVAANIGNFVFSYTFNIPNSTFVRHITFGLALLINFVALLASFKDWKDMVFPFCSENLKNMTTGTSATIETPGNM